MDAVTFASEHGCAEPEAELALGMLGPVLAAELFVRCRQVPEYGQRVAIATELLHRADRLADQAEHEQWKRGR